MSRRNAMTTVAALLGIVITAAIAWSASSLAGQRIGLSSEPLSVANHLAPAPEPPDTARRPAPAAKQARPRGTATDTSTSALAPVTRPSTSTSAPAAVFPAPAAPAQPSRAAQPAEDGSRQPSGGGGRDD